MSGAEAVPEHIDPEGEKTSPYGMAIWGSREFALQYSGLSPWQWDEMIGGGE